MAKAIRLVMAAAGVLAFAAAACGCGAAYVACGGSLLSSSFVMGLLADDEDDDTDGDE
jgi:hypothetical protein